LQRFIFNTISGIILAASTGFIVAKFGYQPMFIIASSSYLMGLIIIHLIMPKLKPIEVKSQNEKVKTI
jgi:ACS family hexuronate transporter-like MFS transporter